MTKSHHAPLPNAAVVTSRREFITFALGGCLGIGLANNTMAATLSGPRQNQMVTIENFSVDGKNQGTTDVARIVKSDDEWRQSLSALAYKVTRQEGTEIPFSGKYASNHAAGLYHCICCDTTLFDAKTKFESGTGWPSFWQPISRHNVLEITDSASGMQRVAVACRRCNAHLGHVFTDGPKPTGLRYCMNSVALNFVPIA